MLEYLFVYKAINLDHYDYYYISNDRNYRSKIFLVNFNY